MSETDRDRPETSHAAAVRTGHGPDRTPVKIKTFKITTLKSLRFQGIATLTDREMSLTTTVLGQACVAGPGGRGGEVPVGQAASRRATVWPRASSWRTRFRILRPLSMRVW